MNNAINRENYDNLFYSLITLLFIVDRCLPFIIQELSSFQFISKHHAVANELMALRVALLLLLDKKVINFSNLSASNRRSICWVV